MMNLKSLLLGVLILVSCFSISFAQEELYKCKVINPYDSYLVEGYLIRSLMNGEGEPLARIIALKPSGSVLIEKLPVGLYYFLYRGYEAKGEGITGIYYQSYILTEDFEINVGFFREDLEPKDTLPDEIPDFDGKPMDHMNDIAKVDAVNGG